MRRSSRILPAVMVMAIGVFFLCANLGVNLPFLGYDNWWAWFMLIGAAWPIGEAVERYRRVGKLDAGVWYALLPALSIVLVASFFILHLSWATWWPLFIVLGGLYMLGGRDGRRYRHWHRDDR